MNSSKHQFQCSLLAAAMMLPLSGCGGSGGSSQEPVNDTPPPAVTGLSLLASGDQAASSATEFESVALWFPGEISSPTWRQLSGPKVTLIQGRSSLQGFDLQEAGDYQFEVTGLDSRGNTVTEQSSFSALATGSDFTVNARRDRQVQSGADVSLRATVSSSGESTAQLSWQQVSGPTVNLTDTSNELLLFTSPSVADDTLLTFRVTAAGSDGSSASDDVSILVKQAQSISSSAYFDEPLAEVSAYRETSPYADDLVDCLYSNQLRSSCTLSKLPLLGMQDSELDINSIMDRVVVSHPWMGERFQAYLQQHDPHGDFRELLRSVTGIVISYDIRPSFYWAATGAIYLDPENIWLQPEERDVINEQADYRSDFGKELQFLMPWRYVLDNQYAFFYYPPEEREHRELADIGSDFAQLLYHELAHANDFFPLSRHTSLRANISVLSAAVAEETLSDQLTDALPLTSDTMYGLAGVRFRGDDATEEEVSMLPQDVAAEFNADDANDFYNYSSVREDLAMLFEELMMQYRFGVQRDIAVTDQPEGDNLNAEDYIVSWGQRGRVATPTIADRANWVLQRVLPSVNTEQVMQALPPVQPMVPGQSWRDNLSPQEQRSIGRGSQYIDRRRINHLPLSVEKPLPAQ